MIKLLQVQLAHNYGCIWLWPQANLTEDRTHVATGKAGAWYFNLLLGLPCGMLRIAGAFGMDFMIPHCNWRGLRVMARIYGSPGNIGLT